MSHSPCGTLPLKLLNGWSAAAYLVAAAAATGPKVAPPRKKPSNSTETSTTNSAVSTLGLAAAAAAAAARGADCCLVAAPEAVARSAAAAAAAVAMVGAEVLPALRRAAFLVLDAMLGASAAQGELGAAGGRKRRRPGLREERPREKGGAAVKTCGRASKVTALSATAYLPAPIEKLPGQPGRGKQRKAGDALLKHSCQEAVP